MKSPSAIGRTQAGHHRQLPGRLGGDAAGGIQPARHRPVVVYGAPLSYWAGVRGKNPMRYMGGLAFGAVNALIASDLGNGVFDGANLVMNFEKMNPGNTWWSKYYNVFANVDTEGRRFIGFERWWSAFYLMNEAEIRWIVENLFIGNKLGQGNAILGGRGPVGSSENQGADHRVRQPGRRYHAAAAGAELDLACLRDEREIRARGQRIIYMVHKDIGHLGIFVSAKVALKEHDRIVGTLETSRRWRPVFTKCRSRRRSVKGRMPNMSSFEERTIKDLLALDDGESDEEAFALVARLSSFWVDAYEFTGRPFVKAMATPALADALVWTHPLRAPLSPVR